jgi:hypothetical protein
LPEDGRLADGPIKTVGTFAAPGTRPRGARGVMPTPPPPPRVDRVTRAERLSAVAASRASALRELFLHDRAAFHARAVDTLKAEDAREATLAAAVSRRLATMDVRLVRLVRDAHEALAAERDAVAAAHRREATRVDRRVRDAHRALLRALARHHPSSDALAAPDAAAAERARADIAEIERRLHEPITPITTDASTTTTDRRGFDFDVDADDDAVADELSRRVSNAAAACAAPEDELRAAAEDVRAMTRRGFQQVTRAREDAILATRAALEEAKATLARERRRTEAFDASRRTLEAMKAAVAADARENEHPPPTRYVPSSA